MAFNDLLDEYTKEAEELDQERREEKRFNPVEGYPFWPHEVVRNAIIALLFLAALFYVTAFMPYYLEAPADPSGQPEVILPDWYLLWTYGMLKIAEDIVIGKALAGLSIFGFKPFPLELMSAKTWGIVMQGIVVGALAVVPFVDRGEKVQRPVEQPFWASIGFAGLIYVFMLNIYSINNLIYSEWSIYGQEYLNWTQQYLQIFRVDLLAWLTHLIPLVAFFVTYIPLWHYKKKHGYEAQLNANYYQVR